MNCEFAEKISLLMDDELPPEEMERVKAHLVECSKCRELEKDFLYLRRQIKESVSAPVGEKQPMPSAHFTRRIPSFWSKWISLPAPAFALLLCLLGALGIWMIATNFKQVKDKNIAENPVEKIPAERKSQPNTSSEISLSRFDKGGRTEIYTVRRQSIASEK